MDEQGEGLWMSPKMGTCGLCQVDVNQRAFVWAKVLTDSQLLRPRTLDLLHKLAALEDDRGQKGTV